MKRIFSLAPHGIAIFAALIFLDSLRFKFTDAPETQEIFGRLDGWAGTLGLAGLFSHTGLFSQYVIGTAELFASAFLLLGIIPTFRRFQALGALFTPLGIDPNNDGGGLFMAAVIIWFTSIAMLIIRRKELGALLNGFRKALFG